MELEYDRAADALYIRFSDGPFHHMESLDDNRHIDYAEDGSIIGIEVLYPSQGVNLDDLPERADVERLLREQAIRVYA